MIVRLEEVVEDLRKRRRGDEGELGSDPLSWLLDLKKAYPRVNGGRTNGRRIYDQKDI